jgi:fatty acid desaturase
MSNDTDLFTPTLTQTGLRELPAGSRPWRLGSQFYVAFFGGPLAIGAIGFLNGKRLELSQQRLWAIAAAALAGFLALVVAVAVVDPGGRARVMIAVAGVASFLVIRELQKDPDRLYAINRDEDDAYDSLWGPGLAAVLVCGIAEAVVLVAVL